MIHEVWKILTERSYLNTSFNFFTKFSPFL